MNIEELLNKYFEGETTCNEERELRKFFSENQVPEHLKCYCPLFMFLDAEVKQQQPVESPAQKKKVSWRKHIIHSFGGLAAALLLLFGIAGISKHFNPLPENYVMIDGKSYTDIDLIRAQAREAFSEVSFSENDIFDTLFDE